MSMTTAHHRNASTPRRVFIVSILLVGFVAGMVLTTGTSKVEASSLFGGLRGPGEAAFVAGHRGDRTNAPENTMPALQEALDGPMAFIETDIQLTKDLVPVLMHDTFVNRTTNGEGRVRDFMFADLQKLDAGAWFSPEFAGTRVPTLEALLSALQVKKTDGSLKKALLELKGYWAIDNVQIVTDLIADYGVGGSVIMSSFDATTIDHLQQADSSLPRAIITKTLPEDPVKYADLYGAIALIVSHSAVDKDPWVVDRMHRAGLGIIVYTLNNKATWKSAIDLGVDGVLTDLPDRLDRWLAHVKLPARPST